MKIYNVYDTLDNELFVMYGTSKQIGRKLKCPPKTVRDYCRKKYLIHRRYRVISSDK